MFGILLTSCNFCGYYGMLFAAYFFRYSFAVDSWKCALVGRKDLSFILQAILFHFILLHLMARWIVVELLKKAFHHYGYIKIWQNVFLSLSLNSTLLWYFISEIQILHSSAGIKSSKMWTPPTPPHRSRVIIPSEPLRSPFLFSLSGGRVFESPGL